jgi:hypothetical protein
MILGAARRNDRQTRIGQGVTFRRRNDGVNIVLSLFGLFFIQISGE